MQSLPILAFTIFLAASSYIQGMEQRQRKSILQGLQETYTNLEQSSETSSKMAGAGLGIGTVGSIASYFYPTIANIAITSTYCFFGCCALRNKYTIDAKIEGMRTRVKQDYDVDLAKKND